MIQNIKVFLQNPKKSKIYDILNINDDELQILKKLLEEYIEGNEDIKVRNILTELFSEDKIKALEYIGYIKKLLEEGWIVISSFSQIKNNDLSILEIFNSSVSLSVAFLKLIEQGSLDLVIPEKTPYNDHLEYLHDQFLRIEIYEQLSNIKSNYSKESASIKRLQSKLKLIENTIKEKIKKTKVELPVQNFIKEYELNEKEEILFLALLKEEYTSSNENAREQNYLLNLISDDEIERIKNRALLDDNSKLISEEIFEYDELFGAFGGYTKIYFLNEDILNELIHPKKKHKIEHIVRESIFDFIEPKKGLDEVILPSKTKEMINTLLKQIDKRVLKLLKEWGIKEGSDIEAKIIFYGPPGTGKTLTAHSIAKELDKPLLSLDSSKILSMYVGESEKNVRRLFDEYYSICEKLKTKPILLLNEADQFLSSRTTAAFSSADKMHNQMQNIFLEQLEKFDGLLIATTNLLETIDSAFSRRFEYKILFEKPTFKERKKLWKLKLPKSAQYEEGFDINKLSSFELTGAQIEVIIKNTAYKVAMRKKPVFKTEDFIEEIKKEKGSAFDSEKELGFIKV
ncbi:aaa family atpase [Nautilia profundicola AmH]|uniref:Aaa family atpase n=1 Tax=Nautilia profundicola (strain ATCC BAA-1463 / DSM 18972 / AmH) TaxID=598659 RepID=B9L628_NAUPA|nr:ATP-binding protein [Nautilia profundicola]ACM92097.1 aaa family atpase [Nautilia profundicola AmH]